MTEGIDATTPSSPMPPREPSQSPSDKVTPLRRAGDLRRQLLDVQGRRLDKKTKPPLMSDAIKEEERIEGRLSVLEFPLSSASGLIADIEGLTGFTPNWSDQMKVQRVVGASLELTGWALGYPGNRGFDETDNALWNAQYNLTESYLTSLLETRATIPDKVPTEDANEVSLELHVGEHALKMSARKRTAYLEEQAQLRARFNLGFGRDDVPASQARIFEEWVEVEKHYLEGVVESKTQSKGRKEVTAGASTGISKKGLYEEAS